MTTLSQVILFILERRNGSTDRELSEAIYGNDRGHQQINQECRLLERRGQLLRAKSGGNLIGNFRQMPKAAQKRPILHLVQ